MVFCGVVGAGGEVRGVPVAEGEALVGRFHCSCGVVDLYAAGTQRVVNVEVQTLGVVGADEFAACVGVGVYPVVACIDLGELLARRADDVARRLREAVAGHVACVAGRDAVRERSLGDAVARRIVEIPRPAAKEPILYRAEAPFRVVDVLIADIADDVARRVVSYKPAGEMVLRVVGLGCHDERILH